MPFCRAGRPTLPPLIVSSRVFLITVVAERTVRVSYDKLGDDVANELVEWFNAVDATYRGDLRELNELNFARFDAKVEQRWAELRGEMQAGFARADAKLEQRTAELRAEMRAGFAELRAEMAQLETRLTKRMFGFWIAQSATTAGLVLALKLLS